jgi:hypothetical protein
LEERSQSDHAEIASVLLGWITVLLRDSDAATRESIGIQALRLAVWLAPHENFEAALCVVRDAVNGGQH